MNNKIKHTTKAIPGLIRHEIYELNDMQYVEQYDDATNTKVLAYVTMFDGIKVCNVWDDGSINLTIPLNWVVNHKSMCDLVEDITRLDQFIAMVNENYK